VSAIHCQKTLRARHSNGLGMEIYLSGVYHRPAILALASDQGTSLTFPFV
jgi:hypothetical protein